MKNKENLFLVRAALIAALYVVLTYFISAFSLASGAIQLRISEVLVILPYFTPAAVPGLFIGCLLGNLLTGGAVWDILFGSLATLLGAVGTLLLSPNRKNSTFADERKSSGSAIRKWLAPLPPILSNTLIIPLVLYYAYGIPGSIPWFMLSVGIGEILSCGVLGMLLLHILNRYRRYLF